MTHAAQADEVFLRLTVDGRDRTAPVDVRMTLVEALRERFEVYGPKQGCLSGDCGACTVQVDGVTRKSCLELAVAVDGAQIRTIEGMASGDRLTPVQEAFCAHGGFQCGFCLSGMLFAAEDLLTSNPDPSESEVREALRGNLCRCTGYTPIVDSVLAAVRSTAPGEIEPDGDGAGR